MTMDNRDKGMHVCRWLTAFKKQSIFNLFPQIVMMNPSILVAHSQAWQMVGCAILLIRVGESQEN